MSNKFLTSVLAIIFFLLGCSVNQEENDLEAGFKNPPQSAKPRTWMHAMSGNMSKEGMTKDLEAIAAAGQGGITLFNIATGIPYGNIAYNSPEHHAILKHAAKECERLGLTFGIHNCAGWSSSAGPWVKPEESMKMVVWSEMLVDGGSDINIKLEQPTSREGFYKDIAVLAYPALKSEIADAEIVPVITASDKQFNISIATNGKTDSIVPIRSSRQKNPWILFDYSVQHTIQSVYMAFTNRDGRADLEISDDGKNFRLVKELKPVRTGKSEWVINEQFDPVTARYFRLALRQPLQLKEVNLMGTRLYDNFVGRSGLAQESNRAFQPLTDPGSSMVINANSIINLTASLDADGNLKTSLPEGKWTIMRFGYSSTGAINRPASKWGEGLEVDKFSRQALRNHFDAFAQKVINNSQGMAPNALRYVGIDSYEMGGQNWTDDFADIFMARKGYDIITFLPLFAGRYMGSADVTADVVYDLNDLYCNLMTENYYQYFTELCNKNGLRSFIEPYGIGPINTLDVAGHADLPITEFWMNREMNYLPGTISGARIYGKNVISAESFTSFPDVNWKMHPAMAKTTGDEAWARGINDFMFHRFTHQANTHAKPGLTMSRWGSHFDRTQTWWMNAGKAWFEYIARGSYMLRQGYAVSDVLVFVGDGSHNDFIDRENLSQSIPKGINYDCSNADVLINRIALKNRKMVLPEGNTYSYLLLENIDIIKLPTLRRIKEIANAGVIIIGDKPKKPAGYLVSDSDLIEFEKLVETIWNMPNCLPTYDFGKVQPDLQFVGHTDIFMHRKTKNEDIYFFSNRDSIDKQFEAVFRVGHKIPEFWDPMDGSVTKLAKFKSEENATRVWIDLKAQQSAFIVFRESSKNVKSIIKSNSLNNYYLDDKNRIVTVSGHEGTSTITLSTGEKAEYTVGKLPLPIDLSNSWDVEFLKEHDFAAKESFGQLTDWKDHKNESIKYYSGTAVYTKTFDLPEKPQQGYKAILDLGTVNIVAEVIINGHNAGVLWINPFETDITNYLIKGENRLEIRVTNQWSNRLIGDEWFPKQDGGYALTSNPPAIDSKMPQWYINNQPMPEGPRTTFCTGQFYNANDDLMPSGLIGPVYIKTVKRLEI